MKIDKATLTDIPQLCTLLDELFSQEAEFTPNHTLQEKGLSKIISNENVGVILVVRKSQKLIGMVNILFTISTALGGRVGNLEDFVVLPEYRNCGIGTKLLSYAVTFAEKIGCQRITLLTDDDNEDAHRFYVRNGFARSSMVPFRLNTLDT
ncbi:MAG: GNAT family N-acetyltransferase [Gammaproteobacteria bacterium]|nr:GNAT family N-acetyltransferase [Gammaproteobacteria bacterium]